MIRFIFFSLLYIISIATCGQDSTHKNPFSFSAYAELYYQYDFNKPTDGNRPGFIYSHNRHNEFNLNIGFIKAAYSTENIRANLSIATGTYINANYTAEPDVIKNIFEANVGIKLSKKKNCWIDVGILPSHIGFESAVSKDCGTLTRSLLAENSPYFEAGAKITYITNSGKWLLSGMLLNGWQRITRVRGNSLISTGTQIQYKPSTNVLLNYSTFIGTDKPDTARLTRLLHNIYGIFTFTEKVGLTVGFDIGTEEKDVNRNSNNTWIAPVAILKYTFSSKWSVTGRAEYYRDKNEVIIKTGTANGFQTTGYSLNIDYAPVKNMLIRVEGRSLNSKDKIFLKETGFTNQNTFVTASMAVNF